MIMEDVQNHRDDRSIPIDKVGVTDLLYPISVLDKESERQQTVARLSMSVDLPESFKGTHMSRFLEVLNRFRGELTMRTLPDVLAALRESLSARSAHVEVAFPYFLEKKAPVTGAGALMDYECTFVGEANGGKQDFLLSVKVPVTSVCPCSKSISDYGAHNQRGYLTVSVRPRRDEAGNWEMVWIEELIEVAEGAASAPVYPVLKRPDERYVTMQAFDNPVFVEDMVRGVAVQLQSDERIGWFRVHAENQESIHNHSAFAVVEWTRPLATEQQEAVHTPEACSK